MKDDYGFFETIWDMIVKPIIAVATVTLYIKLMWEVAKWVWHLI